MSLTDLGDVRMTTGMGRHACDDLIVAGTSRRPNRGRLRSSKARCTDAAFGKPPRRAGSAHRLAGRAVHGADPSPNGSTEASKQYPRARGTRPRTPAKHLGVLNKGPRPAGRFGSSCAPDRSAGRFIHHRGQRPSALSLDCGLATLD